MTSLAGQEAALLLDVSNSQAFKEVEHLSAAGEIGVEQADIAKQRYASIHKHFVLAMSNEKMRLEEAKALNKQLEEAEQRASAAAAASTHPNDAAVMQQLQQDVDAARLDAAAAAEREQLRQLEVAELQRQRGELRGRLDEVEEQHRAALQPQLDELREQTAALEADKAAEQQRLEAGQQELEALRAKVALVQQEQQQLQADIAASKAEFEKEGLGPAKTRRAADLLVSALKGVHAQEEQLNARLVQQEGQVAGYLEKVQQLVAKTTAMQAAIDRAHVAIEAKHRAEDDICKDLEIARLEAENAQAERAGHDMELAARVAAIKREQEMLGRRTVEREKGFRRLKRAQLALEAAQDQLPSLGACKEAAAKEVATLKHQMTAATAALTELKRDTDILINAFLKEEQKGDLKNALFKASWEEIQALEDDVGIMRQEEAERLQLLRDMSSQRDRIARMAADNARKAQDTQDDVAFKQIIIQDLKRARRQTLTRVRDFQQLYDLVKNQRNKFVSLVAVAGQGIAELRSKLKIMGNELEILHGEEANKQKLLDHAQVEHSHSCSDRDQQRGELNRCTVQFRKRQSAVDEQIAEIDKLNAVINSAERDMLRLRKEYEGAIESRNYTGIMLIDRNDELCILYEKTNIQEEVARRGETALGKREDEIRMLNLEAAELQRACEATRKLQPAIPGIDAEIAGLKAQLLEARRESERLALQLESPANKDRWRRLEGKFPDKEELAAKVNQLEERVHGRREVLLERNFVLEELEGLSGRLRSQAADGWQDTLELAQKANDYQVKLRGITRRMMATVSEMSMWQASSIKYSAERQELAAAVAQAAQRLEAGQAPTDDADREWHRMQREDAQLAELRHQTMLLRRMQQEHQAGPASLAEPRPNAYIPEDLGIPKPYGGFAPFKPTESGSTMRHIRDPQPRELVI